MDIRTSETCQGCDNLAAVERIRHYEAMAEEAGTLVSKGSFACEGLRKYKMRGSPQERCRVVYDPPVTSDEELTAQIAQNGPSPHVRPAL